MPKVYTATEAKTPQPLRARVQELIKSLRPGECVSVRELAREWECTPQGVAEVTPRPNLAVRCIPGNRHPARVILCPPSTKSDRK